VAAVAKLRLANSAITLEAAVQDVNADTVLDLVGDVDLVMDGTDNFETHYLLNEACVKAARPWIYSAAVGSYGVTMAILPGESPCLRCIFPHRPPPGVEPTCDTAGVLNPIPSVIASLACAEALKLLVGARERLSGEMVWIDVWHNASQRLPLGSPVVDCPVCQLGQYEHLEAREGSVAAALCGRDAVQVRPRGRHEVDLDALAERLRAVGPVVRTPYLLRLDAGEYELTLFPDARAIVKGTDDPAVARGLYARYIGL
jgi:adenylyltransferase/sulfurtransferase